ncbi:hypothetical protein IF1G_04087 [Cordyceps javanica]|uniref:Uncharacterized protein n=1 Tax=Cordyceps javanica TaxID=43265 RepID=A0A545V551_9HYPO|nr:hypothetical protein IF1G_04087 [Cordyceps javanica]
MINWPVEFEWSPLPNRPHCKGDTIVSGAGSVQSAPRTLLPAASPVQLLDSRSTTQIGTPQVCGQGFAKDPHATDFPSCGSPWFSVKTATALFDEMLPPSLHRVALRVATK